jgi:SHS2 domain-containing protein
MTPVRRFRTSLGSGHRLVEHIGDCVIEAWAKDPASCIAEAVLALVESFAFVSDPPTTTVRPVATSARGAEDALVSLLEEVIFSLDVRDEVPVRVHLVEAETGGFVGDLEVVSTDAVRLIGPVPKAVSYHELEMHHDEQGWWCHVLVDL